MAARRSASAPAARSPGGPRSARAGLADDEPAAADRGAARAALAGLGPAQIDEAVAGEIGVEDDVAEPALAAIIDRGHAGDVERRGRRRGRSFSAPRLLGDQGRSPPGRKVIAQGSSKLRDLLDLEGPVLRRRRRRRRRRSSRAGAERGTKAERSERMATSCRRARRPCRHKPARAGKGGQAGLGSASCAPCPSPRSPLLPAAATIVPAAPGPQQQLSSSGCARSAAAPIAGRVVSQDAADREMAASRLVIAGARLLRARGPHRLPRRRRPRRASGWSRARRRASASSTSTATATAREDVRSQYGGDTRRGRAARGGRNSPPTPSRATSSCARTSRNRSPTSGRSRSTRAGGFAYALRRPSRNFRVEFDLSRPIADAAAALGRALRRNPDFQRSSRSSRLCKKLRSISLPA